MQVYNPFYSGLIVDFHYNSYISSAKLVIWPSGVRKHSFFYQMQHTETQSHAQGAGFTHLLHWWSKHTLCQSTSEQNKVNLIKQQKTHLETWQGQHDTDKWWGRSCGLTWANHGFNMGEPSFCAHIPFFWMELFTQFPTMDQDWGPGDVAVVVEI
jgi:hypothetical protein